MLFKIPPLGKSTVKKENPGWEAIPEFCDLSDKQARTLILVFDYRSPFRQRPQKDRWKLAFLAAGYEPENTKDKVFNMRCREMMDGKHTKFNEAIKKYLEMQYDDDFENLQAIQTQIENIKAMVNKSWTDPDDLKKINGLLLSLPDLREAQKTIMRNSKIEYSFGEPEEDAATQNMSTIDRMVLDESNEV